jgi:Ca2+-binding RTX toxin-like protein
MAWIVPFENTGTDVDLGTTDSIYIGQPIYFAARVRGTGSNQSIIVEGQVAGGGPTAMLVLGDTGTTGNLIHITETGRVTSVGDPEALIAAMGTLGISSRIINEGVVNASFGRGIGIATTGQAEDTDHSIYNSGTIRAASIGVVSANLSGKFTLTNTGTIIGALEDLVVPGENGGTLHQGSFLSLGVHQEGGIYFPDVDESIYNSGRMVGSVWLGGGADYYEGRNGRIEGEVHGGDGADKLFAGVGNDRLFGENGIDQLMGGLGADYLDGGAGTDTVLYVSAATGVTASLSNAAINTGEAAGDTYVSIENLTGSGFNDVLVGNGAANILSGGNGNDSLRGAAGNDILAGGAGRDFFVFAAPLSAATNVDRINDFTVVDDTIQLENTYFTALTTTGVLAASALQINTTGVASTANDRIIYESDTGNLYYDPDGVGGAAATLFAKLTLDLALTNADFVVI